MEDGLVRVPLGPCTCPGTPHEQDEVYLRPKLGMARALAIIKELTAGDMAVAEMQLVLGYSRFGIAEWNLSNGTGKPMPVDAEHLAAFSDSDPRAILVAVKGDELYAGEVTAPLLTMAAVSSTSSSETGETSQTSGTRRRPSRKRSKRSSTTTTQTVGTATTTASLDGDSSS